MTDRQSFHHECPMTLVARRRPWMSFEGDSAVDHGLDRIQPSVELFGGGRQLVGVMVTGVRQGGPGMCGPAGDLGVVDVGGQAQQLAPHGCPLDSRSRPGPQLSQRRLQGLPAEQRGRARPQTRGPWSWTPDHVLGGVQELGWGHVPCFRVKAAPAASSPGWQRPG
jgi:hypothetical protein